MKLINATYNDCLAASLAMLLDATLDYVKVSLFPDPPEYPFPDPWSDYPLVPDMNIIAEWLVSCHSIAITPFEYCPRCAPDKTCPSVSPYNEDPTQVFENQLELGPGLIEFDTKKCGHMTAWDGESVFDPRGYVFNFEDIAKMHLVPRCFWLASKIA